MKKVFFASLLAILAPAMALAGNADLAHSDTTLRIGDRTLVITEGNDEIDIDLYQHLQNGNSVRKEKIFKGVYMNGRSIEQRYRNSIFYSPIILKSERDYGNCKDHLSLGMGSFGLGFVNLSGKGGDHLNASSSLRYSLGLLSLSTRINKWLAIAPNLNIEFNSIHLKDNYAFKEVEGVTQAVQAEEGVVYDKSRLHITYMNIAVPLIMKKCHSNFSIYVAPVVKFKTASSSKIWLSDSKKHQKYGSDLNLNPVVLEGRAGIRYSSFNIYGSYTLTPIFKNDKGPDTHMYAIGVSFGL